MARVTFIYPSIGRFPDTRYVRSWQMQPLGIAVLAALTPLDWQKDFYDDRLEQIDYDKPTDLVAISIETYTARRGYQIAEEFHRRGVPVVMGGYHATFCTEEVLEHADAVCVGEAEGVWNDILEDKATGQLSRVYSCPPSHDLRGVKPDRNIFRGKNYFKMALVETGRGCRFKCNFCSITAFHKATYRRRPIDEIIGELKQLKEKRVFFVDDNVIGDVENAKELFHALKPLGIQWMSQASVNVARDPALLDLMVESGCLGLLIGFESLNPDNLISMRKSINENVDYEKALRAMRERGILVYGTFMFGFPGDTPQLIRDTVQFAKNQKLFLAAFNHATPFPGTPLYDACDADRRLVYDRWWMSDEFAFGELPFEPECMTSSELEQCCHQARRDFYGLTSILHRSIDLKANCARFQTAAFFFGLNLLLHREVSQKRGIPLGLRSATTSRNTRQIRIELAKPSDEMELRKVLHEMPMPGAIHMAYLREPSFFGALQVEGRDNRVLIGRDNKSGRIVGLGSRSIKTVFINGSRSPLGYLSSLRLAEEYRGGTYLARGYQTLHELHQDRQVKLYITTIMEDNSVAREILTSHRAGLPAYHDYGLYCCMAISMQQNKKIASSREVNIRCATREDVPAIIEFWRQEGAKKQFFPEYKAADLLSSDGLLRGLKLEDTFLAFDGEELVGTTAAWDQKSFRQSLVTGYNKQLRFMRLPYNGIARLLRYPILPNPGSILEYVCLSLICIRKDDPYVFASLLMQIIKLYRSRYSLLTVGLHERDPLLSVLRQYRHFPYTSRLYVVCWEDGEEDFSNLDLSRIPYLELGAL